MKVNEVPEQYISKSALVAEIEKWRDRITKGIFSIPLTGHDRACATFEYEILGNVKDFIDTLEVKEVDLNKEISNYLGDDWRKDADGKIENEMIAFAKHFFELGMQQSKNYNDNEE